MIYGNPYDLWPTDHVQNSVDDQVSQQKWKCSPIEPAKPGCKPGSLEDTNPKTESGFNPKLMQIRCKPGGLEDKDPKTECGLGPKIMQKHSKPGSLKDQDPKSKISKINFASWIRGFCIHSSHPFFEESGSANWI